MSSFPAVTFGSLHICPLCTGPAPHVGGPVTGPGAVGVFHNNKPAAVVGDLCTCVGAPPAVIVSGQPGIFHSGAPAVAMNGMTSHGGTFATGEPNIMYGPVTEVREPYQKYKRKSATQAEVAVEAPEASTVAAQEVEERARTQVQSREEGERRKYPRIYNMQWLRERLITQDSALFKVVTIRADVQDIDDGEEVNLTIRMPQKDDVEGEEEQEVVRLKGIVKDQRVEVVWKVEEFSSFR